jgi:hypothetical protein
MQRKFVRKVLNGYVTDPSPPCSICQMFSHPKGIAIGFPQRESLVNKIAKGMSALKLLLGLDWLVRTIRKNRRDPAADWPIRGSATT